MIKNKILINFKSFSTSCKASAKEFTHTVLMGHPFQSIRLPRAIQNYKQGNLNDYITECFENRCRITGALFSEKQRRSELNFWLTHIRLFVEDQILEKEAKKSGLKFSPNAFIRREQRFQILNSCAPWRNKPKTTEQIENEKTDMENRNIIDKAQGYSYTVPNHMMKKYIHRILLQSLHKSQLEYESASNGWSLRQPHKRFPKDLLMDPHSYFFALGYRLRGWPFEKTEVRVSHWSDFKLRSLLAYLIKNPIHLEWRSDWRPAPHFRTIPVMENVLEFKPHKIAYRPRSPYTEPLRDALIRRAEKYGFDFQNYQQEIDNRNINKSYDLKHQIRAKVQKQLSNIEKK